MNSYSVNGYGQQFLSRVYGNIGFKNIEGMRILNANVLEFYSKPDKLGKIKRYRLILSEDEVTHYPDRLNKSWNSKNNTV